MQVTGNQPRMRCRIRKTISSSGRRTPAQRDAAVNKISAGDVDPFQAKRAPARTGAHHALGQV